MLRNVIAPLLLVVLILSLQPAAQCQETSHPNKHQYSTQISPSPSAVFTSAPSTQVGQPTTSQQTGNTNANLNHDCFDWYAAFGPATWSNWALVIAAAVAAVVALKTLGAIGVSNLTAIRIARATKHAADAAKMAATAERPYLLIEKANLDGVVSTSAQRERQTGIEGGLLSSLVTMFANPETLNDVSRFFPTAGFTFKNYGKGPALVEDLLATIAVVDELPPPRNFTACQPIAVHPEAVGAGEPLNVRRIFSVTLLEAVEEKVTAIRQSTKTLIVYGRLKYRDVSKNPHETGFCWIFTPPKPAGFDVPTGRPDFTAPILPHQFSRGPDSHNYSD